MMDTNTSNIVNGNGGLEELKSSIREISNVNVSDEVFVNKSKELIESKNLEESKKKVIEEYVGRILESRIENRKIIEDKNSNTLDIEEWHSELRARLETRYNEELARIKNREKNKKLSLNTEKVRKLEKEEYDVGISKYLGEDVYKELVGTLRFTSGGLLDSRDPINYDIITQHDKYIQEHIVFNEFTNNIEVDGKTITNNDLLTITSHFSRIYGIHNDTRIINAVTNPNNLHSYHPIKDIIEYKKWDGTERIDRFFQDICNVEIKNEDDEIYYREVARMLFFGGIKRLYEPGSKFDYMLIFEGRQGTGKSTLVRLLALSDIAYSEVTTIEGQAGIENVQGSWICEFAELLAMVRTRDIEAIKAFITRQYDKYRPPYGKIVEVIPRQCVFIGTTNDSEFLKDSTGNRRYLPVAINTNVKYLFSHLKDVQKYILECWREAFYKYMNNEIYLTIPNKYNKIVEKKRQFYTLDDPVEGVIMAYCESKKVGDEVCGIEIYTKCMNGLRKNYSTADSRNVARVMRNLKNWEKIPDRKYFQDYGQQRYWRKMYDDIEDVDDTDDNEDDL